MTLPSGARLGPYEILSRLGAGGMGEVYRARDTRLDRTVAIKVLLPGHSMSPELSQRFEREARAVSRLNHPHICTLHDVGRQDGIDFLVMEYLEGETLAERLKRGALPPAQALRFAIEIADALDKAHRQGIVHRDLKPGNVMLTKAGTKLLDFGLAKVAAAIQGVSSLTAAPTATGPVTAEGAIIGTLQYMAPELLQGREADPRADLFAFGAMLYEMVTGARAFEGKSPASVIAAILSSEPEPILTRQPLAPLALGRLVRVCLAKDPDERWQSARDLRAELEWIAEGATAAAVVPGAGGFRNRERMVWAVALASVSLGFAALWLGPFRHATLPTRSLRLSVTPPGDDSGIGEAVISPDGRWLAFTSAAVEGRNLLWVRALDSLEAKALAGTEQASNPFWSPDSRLLGFFANGKLQKVQVPGGRPEVVCDAPFGRGGAWNRDGVILFGGLSDEGRISRVSASGGRPAAATWPTASPQGTVDLYPHFLPDGRHFLFLRGAPQDGASGIYAGSLDSKDEQRLLGVTSNVVAAAPGYLLFVQSGSLVAQRFNEGRLRLTGEPVRIADSIADNDFAQFIFSVSDTGILAYRSADPTSRLTWLDRNGKAIGTVGEPADYVHVELSPDGTRVAVERIDPQSRDHDVWLLDVTEGTASRLTFDAGWDGYPIWSPDGSRIAFSSERDGRFDLYEKPASGAGKEEVLLRSDLEEWPSSWSPDGRFIVSEGFSANEPPDLWLLPLEGDRKPVLFEKTPAWENLGQISPDGRWLAYCSGYSGRVETYVQSFPTPGGKWQVSKNGGGMPRWRGDGKELFYAGPGGELMAVDVTGDGAFRAGTPKPLFLMKGAKEYKNRFSYAVSRDGRRFLVNVVEKRLSTVTISLDWAAGLGRE